MKHLQTLKLVKPEKRGEKDVDWYAAEPGVIYPNTIDFIVEFLTSGEAAPEFLLQTMMAAKNVDAKDWELAKKPLQKCPPERRAGRGAALEIARLIFTALLRVQNGRPIGLHILKDERYQL